jgi:hypothetical protein
LGRSKSIGAQVAGPTLTADQFRAATVPDGPTGDWAGGEYERIEDQNRKALESCGTFTNEPTIVDVIFSERSKAHTAPKYLLDQIPADLSIPPFLDRRPRPELKAAA